MLEAEKIDVFYGDVQALWGVSFSVVAGEIVTLVGSNGAGKTTMLRAISGLLKPTSGVIRFMGQEIQSLPPHQIVERGIAHIPEGRKLWPWMTVVENLELGAYTKEARRQKKESIAWAFALFPRLRERRNQLAGTLSGGEQQMLAIARGLMSRPKLLMFDEPSLGLAPLLVAEVFRVICEINTQGVTVLLIEQNLHHALRIADRAYVLETGRVVLQGRGQELLENDYVKTAYLGL